MNNFVLTMTFHVEIGDDAAENRQRFRQAYEDAERLMFGEEDSGRAYTAVVGATVALKE